MLPEQETPQNCVETDNLSPLPFPVVHGTPFCFDEIVPWGSEPELLSTGSEWQAISDCETPWRSTRAPLTRRQLLESPKAYQPAEPFSSSSNRSEMTSQPFLFLGQG